MREKILEILKSKHEYISGQDLSGHLGISRQALWKHIQELRDEGYDIVAVPHLGYLLVSLPDKLLPWEITYGLDTKFIGKKIYYRESVSSTMDMAWQLGLDGVSEGTLILAETQVKGRGRLGRGWTSPKSQGIYLSLILKPKILPNQSPVFNLLSAVSVCEAVKIITGIDAQIKWPNDILVQHRKLGGILTELNAEMDAVHFMVIGIGLNVNNDKKSLISLATSLEEEKKESVNRVELLREILRKIEINYLLLQDKGSSLIIEKWREHNITLGRRVRIVLHNRDIEGEAADIDIDGSLLLRKDSGVIERVVSGDVVHCSALHPYSVNEKASFYIDKYT